MDKNKLNNLEIKKLKEQLKTEAHEKVISRASALRSEYKKQVSTAIITAFGLVIALAWKDVVTALLPSITTPYLLEKYPLIASLYTALVITGIAVIGILLISNWSKPKENANR
jgi:hypothetical protein